MSAACIAACSAATMAASNAALIAARNANRTATMNASRRRESRSYTNECYTPMPQTHQYSAPEKGHPAVWIAAIATAAVAAVILGLVVFFI